MARCVFDPDGLTQSCRRQGLDEKKLSMRLKIYSLNAFPKRNGCSDVINQEKKVFLFCEDMLA